jgi:hypothetical protein
MLAHNCLLPSGLFARICVVCGLLAAQAASVPAQVAPAPQANQAANFRYWTTSWSFEEIDLRDLSAKLSSIGFELPIEISGTASVNFDVSIPLNGLRNAKAYKFRGSLSSTQFKADQFVLEEFAANVTYSEGIVRLTDLRGKQNGGSFSGSATADVASQGPFEAALTISRLQLGPIAQLLEKLGIGRKDKLASGSVDGEVKLSGNLSKIREIAAWNATGKLRLQKITIGDSIPYSITIDDLSLRDGRLVIADVGVRSSALPEFFLRAGVDAELVGKQTLDISLQADDIPATDLLGLYFDSPQLLFAGKLDLQGNVTGELNPAGKTSPNLNMQLALASPSIQVLGIDLGLLEHQLTLTSESIELQPLRAPDETQALTIDNIRANYLLQPQRLKIMNFDAKVFGGTLAGNAELARVAAGEHSVAAEWKDLNPKVTFPLGLGSNPVRLSATTTGNVNWSAPAAKVEFPAFHRADVQVQVDPLILGTEALGSADVTLKINDSGLELRGDGKLFGGRVELTSTAPLDPAVRWSDVPKLITGGQLLLSNVRVDELIKGLAAQNPRRFAGQISGTTEVTLEQGQVVETKSRWLVRDLGVDGQILSRRLDADIATRGSQVNVRSIKGNYAGGQVQASGQWSLAGGSRTIDARVVRAEGDLLLLPLNPSANQWVSGKVSGRATIVGFGAGPFDDFRIRGTARLTSGRSFDIPIGDARTPLRVVIKRDPLTWQADFANVRSELAQGQINGELHFSSSGASRQGFDMDSRWRWNHVEFEELLHTYVGTTTLGRGDVTGGFALGGRDIRSLHDLQGEFRMKFGGTDVAALPGLSATSALLGVASLLGTRFNSGEAVGRISRGNVGIQQLVLLSDRLKVISSGRVGLQDGRMEMVTIATTGSFMGQTAILEGIAPNALASLTPVSSLNRIFSDRTVVVNILGTLRKPRIQLRVGETLQANVRQQLVRQLTGQIALEAALLDQIDW